MCKARSRPASFYRLLLNDVINLTFLFLLEYASTYYAGSDFSSDKAILVPTAHTMLRLALFPQHVSSARYIAHNTAAEREFVNRIARNQHVPGIDTGIGINVPDNIDGDRFLARYN